MTQAGLVPLPFELLTLIITYLKSDTSSLASLALVSRNLNKVTTPTLYEQFRGYKNCQSDVSAYNFVHTILTRPDLARHVRHVTLRPTNMRAWVAHKVHEDFPTLCRDAMNKVFAAWLSLVMPDEQRQIWSKYHGNIPPDTLQIILLCSLPNLETLFLDNNGKDVHICLLFDAVSRLVNLAVPQPPPFSELRSIRRTTVRDPRGHVNYAEDALHECLEYFKLPSLIRLEFHNIQSIEYASRSNHDWTLAQRSSQVQYLSIRHSHLSSNALTSMIETCATLKEFRYTFGCKLRSILSIKIQDVLQALQRHARTLETLDLSLEPCLLQTSSRYYDSPLPSLLAFKNLKSLTYSIWLMPWHNAEELDTTTTDISKILPPFLEVLHVTHCDPEVPRLVRLIELAKRAGHLPCLRRLRLSLQPESESLVDTESLSVVGVNVERVVSERFCISHSVRLSNVALV